jgi:hypothetical protein
VADASDLFFDRGIWAVSDGEGYPVLDVEGVAGPHGDGVLVSEIADAAFYGAAEHARPHRHMMRQRCMECERETPTIPGFARR